MKYQVRYKKAAAKDIARLNPIVQKRLKAKLEYFYSHKDPLSLAQHLTKPADAQYRWRVGDYRVLFDVEKDRLVILRVMHRREVYRKP